MNRCTQFFAMPCTRRAPHAVTRVPHQRVATPRTHIPAQCMNSALAPITLPVTSSRLARPLPFTQRDRGLGSVKKFTGSARSSGEGVSLDLGPGLHNTSRTPRRDEVRKPMGRTVLGMGRMQRGSCSMLLCTLLAGVVACSAARSVVVPAQTVPNAAFPACTAYSEECEQELERARCAAACSPALRAGERIQSCSAARLGDSLKPIDDSREVIVCELR